MLLLLQLAVLRSELFSIQIFTFHSQKFYLLGRNRILIKVRFTRVNIWCCCCIISMEYQFIIVASNCASALCFNWNTSTALYFCRFPCCTFLPSRTFHFIRKDCGAKLLMAIKENHLNFQLFTDFLQQIIF